ncbi:Rossmann-like and DUF2520 domain-containing protein [Flavobacteriaceae bacterium M23B6Z8]
MNKVVLLGSGNMAWHLCKAFTEIENVTIIQHYHHRSQEENFQQFGVDFTNDLKKLKKADFYILAVADDAIAPLSAELPVLEGIVLHTSGTVGMNDLDAKHRKGVFYPLQTLTKGVAVDFLKIPICCEAANSSDLKLIMELANSISTVVVEMSSEKRLALHLAAVFANNFVNHLYNCAYDICKSHQVETHLLEALIKETAKKVVESSPEASQTGPAKRGDKKTINTHLNMLEEDYKTIYKTISESLLDHYGREKL